MKRAPPEWRSSGSWSLGGRLDNATLQTSGALDQVLEAPGVRLAIARSGGTVRRMAERMAGHRWGPLYDAAAAERLALTVLFGHRTPFPGGLVKASVRRGRPVAVFIIDDAQSRGPSGWLCVRRLIEWRPAVVMVLEVGAERENYVQAARAAERYGRALIVETDSATAPLWLARFDFQQNRRVLN